MFLGLSSMEFGTLRPKTVEHWSVRLVKNLKIESKLGFQVKITVFEGVRLGDLRGPKITASSVEFGRVRSENAPKMSLEGSDGCYYVGVR